MKRFMAMMLAAVLMTAMLAGCSTEEKTTTATTGVGGEEVFGEGKYITVVSREDGSGTRGAFIELFGIEEKDENGNKTDRTTEEAIIANKTDVVITNIAEDKYAIGYVSIGSLSDDVKALKIDGVEAGSDNVKSGEYKAFRPFNIAVKSEVSEVTQDFINFILSKEGQAVVSESYVAVNDEAESYSGTKPQGKVVVAGSSSVTPVMEKLKEAYLLVNPNAEIEVQMSDSTAGMTGAIEGTCDIGMASRSLKDSEKEQLTPIEIAYDGIAVIVNPENTNDNITSEQVKAVFTGEKTEWDQLAE